MTSVFPLLHARTRRIREIEPSRSPCPLDDAAIASALRHPIGPGGSPWPALCEIIRPRESVCLVVSDHTRKTAADRVLPFVLRELSEAGARREDVFVLFASGIHRHPTTDEVARILGPVAQSVLHGRIFFHDPDRDSDLVEVGTTGRGCRVRVNRRAMEADRRLLLGSATYHYHAGFGGGRKSLVPGLASRDTIAFNHSLTLDPVADRFHPGVEIGRLDGNPVHEEMLEGARLCRPDFMVNTVLTPSGDLADIYCGDLDAAHRAACRAVERLCRVNLDEPADLVVASAGSARNWIQSHKALVNATRAVSEQGMVVLEAPCPEGLGDERFRRWVRERDVARLCAGLRRSPEVLGQTALSTRIRGRRTILVTAMPPEDTADLGIRAFRDMAAAVDAALTDLAHIGIASPSCYLLPQALSTTPFLRQDELLSSPSGFPPTADGQHRLR